MRLNIELIFKQGATRFALAALLLGLQFFAMEAGASAVRPRTCESVFNETPTAGAGFDFKLASPLHREAIVKFVKLQRQRIGVDPERGADGRSTTLDIESFETFYGSGNGRFFLLTDEKGLVGTSAYTRIGPAKCEIKRIYVDERARGKGLGREMIEKAIQAARHDGYTSMILQTRPEMSDAVHLYEKIGFKKVLTQSSTSVYIYSLDLT